MPCLPALRRTRACCWPGSTSSIDDGAGGPIHVDTAVVDDTERPILVSTRLLQEALFAVGADEEVPDHGHALADLDDVDLSDRLPRWTTVSCSTARTGWPARLRRGSRTTAPWRGWPTTTIRSTCSSTEAARSAATSARLATGSRTCRPRARTGSRWCRGRPPAATCASLPRPDAWRGSRAFRSTPRPRSNGTRWCSMAAGGSRDCRWLLPFATIQPVANERTYVVWFNLDAPENQVDVEPGSLDGALEVLRETDSGSFLRRVGPVGINPVFRNVFSVEVREESTRRCASCSTSTSCG